MWGGAGRLLGNPAGLWWNVSCRTLNYPAEVRWDDNMSDVTTFFRHCPACGRRFEIRVVKKELAVAESQKADMPHVRYASGTGAGMNMGIGVTLVENVPSIVNEEEFKYTYRCKHCGHQWTELHDEETQFKEPPGFEGD